MATIIDGRVISKQIQSEVETEIRERQTNGRFVPGLAVVLVGDDPASHTYVGMKAKTCQKLGMHSIVEKLPAETIQADLLALIDRLNAAPEIHGILVQLPLPAHLDAAEVVLRVDPRKDVDGLHPANVGLLCARTPRFIPCTPFGIGELLTRSGVKIAGREVVIVGRSNLVGRPLSVLMSSKGKFGDATVTVCHSRSADLPAICRRADILVVAIGQREFIHADMVKPGAVVIDVGTHPAKEPGGKMTGDVHFASVEPVASQITPVPGGVGPMTIAMLMRNTLNAAIMQRA